MSSSERADRAPGRPGRGSSASSSSIIGLEIGGDFEIRGKIGQGGMGTVYEAWQRSLSRTVAIKVLSAPLGASPRIVTRFQREAQAAAKLHHPNIVPIYAQGEHDGVYYYAMELVEGKSLNEIIVELRGDRSATGLELTETKLVVGMDGGGAEGEPSDSDLTAKMPAPADPSGSRKDPRTPLSETTHTHFDEIAGHIASAADALDYAHKHGVIHRDVKPHNFMLGNDDRLYVTDFGLALVLEQPGMTMTGEFIGSPLYMSPEQISGGAAQVDHRSDIYSLGATLYEWLTLQPPFPGETREEVIRKIMSDDPPPPRSLNPHTPTDLETICLKALSKAPHHRYASANEMAEDLRRFVRKEVIRARRESMLARARKVARRRRMEVLAIGVAIAAISVTWAVQSHLEKGRRAELIAAKQEGEQRLGARIESLKAERDRLAQQLGNVPLESAVGGWALEVMGDVASGALSAITGPAPGRAPAPPAPQSPTEAIVFTQQDLRLLGLLTEEFVGRLRADSERSPAVGGAESPIAGAAEEYYQEALYAGDAESALGLANLALQSAFDHFDALYLRSLVYLRLSKFEEARSDAETMILFREGSAAGYLTHGLVSLVTGEVASSGADLDRAARLEPRLAGVWVARGAAYSRLGRYAQALNDFDRALELTPGHVAAKEEREHTFVRARYSLRELSDLLAQEPSNYDALVRRGDLYFLLGEYGPAMADYRKASASAEAPSGLLLQRLYLTRKKLDEGGRRSGDSRVRSSGRSALGYGRVSDSLARRSPPRGWITRALR